MELPQAMQQPRSLVHVHKSALRSHGRSIRSDGADENNRPLVYTRTLTRHNQRMHDWKLRMERVFAGQAY